MLTLFRRHRKSCPHKSEGRSYRRCQCPIWVDGTVGAVDIRRSLDLRDWQKAQAWVRDREVEGRTTAEQTEPVSIEQAWERFLGDAEARKLHEATVYKYRFVARQMKDFAQRNGFRFLNEINADALGLFRQEWKDGPRSGLKKLERLRAFFGFAQRRKWISDNPARELKPPKVPPCPTLPFTGLEMVKTLAALEKYSASAGVANAQRLRAFVLLLRYSGMRIGDAVQCSTDRLTGDKLFLYTQKTGVPVYCVLPDFVVQVLEAAPRTSDRYFFWTGCSKLHSAIGKWQRRLQRLFELAEVPKGHAHRFRDTFAVELLLSGVPLDRVSVLLGHSSVQITERHYAPWTRSRQEQIEADLRLAWSRDPVVQTETKGTYRVHGEGRAVN
jgi:integrase/recombinase XerD